MNPINTLRSPPVFFAVHFNILLPMPGFFRFCLPIAIINQTLHTPLAFFRLSSLSDSQSNPTYASVFLPMPGFFRFCLPLAIVNQTLHTPLFSYLCLTFFRFCLPLAIVNQTLHTPLLSYLCLAFSGSVFP